MRVQYIQSACVLVEHNGTRVLCDPWLTEGIYYGSWYHFPPLIVKPEDFSDVDYIYISHVHPDHLDPNTLKRLPKTIPVLVHNYADKFVLNILKSLGFQNIHEVSHGDTYTLAPDFTIQILAADNCDPAICGRYFECAVPIPYNQTRQIDSLGVFCGGGKTVVNVNDCPYPLSRTVCDLILDKYKHVDFLLTGYSGAGPYPQCFDNLNDEQKLTQMKMHRDMKLNEGFSYIRHLKPDAFMPFAGQYTLGAKLSPLNRFLAPKVEELPQLFSGLLNEKDVRSKMVLVNSMESYDLETKKATAPFNGPTSEERQNFIYDVLSRKKLDYENDPENLPENQIDLTEKLNEAHQKMRYHQKQFGISKSDWNVYIDAGQGYAYHIPLDDRTVSKVNLDEYSPPFLRIGLDYALLMRILNRKAHWNNAEVGSLLRYYRNPNQYHRYIHQFISYFHC